MDFNLRKLTAKDIFPLSTILSKIGVKEFKDAFNNIDMKAFAGTKDEDLATKVRASVILDIVGIIRSNLAKCEGEIYAFLASVTGMKKAEIAELDFGDFMDLIVAIAKKEEFSDFFKRASTLLR